MKTVFLFLPAAVFTALYGFLIVLSGHFPGIFFVWNLWLALFYAGSILLHKNRVWGCMLGMFPAIQWIDMGSRHTGPIILDERPFGIAVLLYYALCGAVVFVQKRRDGAL